MQTVKTETETLRLTAIETSAVTSVLKELARALEKHPTPFASAHEGYAILQEEVEELWDAIKCDDGASVEEEVVQVAAMALRFLIDGKAWKKTSGGPLKAETECAEGHCGGAERPKPYHGLNKPHHAGYPTPDKRIDREYAFGPHGLDLE